MKIWETPQNLIFGGFIPFPNARPPELPSENMFFDAKVTK